MSDKYGFVGWREFLSTRKEILNEIDRAKALNSSRPVQVEHGNAGEAEFRRWLSHFLPDRYGVTSGYVIPDTIQADSEKIRHYDVIIYDRQNAPKLWIDGSKDKSEQGRSKAIPAKYIHAVFECKANFSRKTCQESIAKLSELNEFDDHLSSVFSCGIIFFDLASTTQSSTLKHLIPDRPIIGFWGGLVMRSDVSEDACGNIFIIKAEGTSSNNEIPVPIVKRISDLNIKRDENGNVTIGEQGAGVMAFAGPDKQWHFSKQYGPMFCSHGHCLMLSWSHNGFARFALDLLNLLEGKPLTEGKNMFGQVFDDIG